MKHQGQSGQIKICGELVLEETKIGDSIGTNGVCLTVSKMDSGWYIADVMGETLERSNLGSLSSGDQVNLERAMTLNRRFGGHMVSGHIDGTGTVVEYQKIGNAVWITIETEDALLRYMVEKGSVAIDGTSLTVAKVYADGFQVSVIPHTGMQTTLLTRKLGSRVNLECDMVGKYVERLLEYQCGIGVNTKPIKRVRRDHNRSISKQYLLENGFF